MRTLNVELLQQALESAYTKLDEKKEIVNQLNVFPVPDGDTGTNMALTMKSALEQVQKLENPDISSIAKALGNGSLMGARGNSGVILSQLCRGLAKTLKGKEIINVEEVANIFESATKMAYKAVMRPTEGTILTVARCMSEFASDHKYGYEHIEIFLKDIVLCGQQALNRTPEQLKQLKDAGVVDAGGQGLIYLLIGFTEALGQEFSDEELQSAVRVDLLNENSSDKHEYQYRFQCAVEQIESVEECEKEVLKIDGEWDFKNDEYFFVTGLTDFPGKVLDRLCTFGFVHHIEITHQAKDQQSLKIAHKKEQKEEKKQVELKPYGFVAVSLGEGFDHIFRDLLVDEIVSGGQTMNPSTKELYEAVEKVAAETVFILPNNKNIIMAAQQVSHLTEKQIIVIPTKSVPQGFTALFNFDESLSPQENQEQMERSLSTVKTGQVTHAIRDTEINGIEIHEGDYLGLLDGDIVKTGTNPEELVIEMLEQYTTDEMTLITVYRGKDVDSKRAEDLKHHLHNRYDDFDVEFQVGNQPTYYYVFSME